MRIYSDTIFTFITKAEAFLKDIVKNEMSLEVKRSRFQWMRYSYPIHIVVFTETMKIGYFDHHTYQIGLHQSLIYQVKDSVLKDILRHEFAHYINYLQNPLSEKAHGPEFQKICAQYNWNSAISKASMDIDLANFSTEGEIKNEKIIHKVKSLFNLAQSSNPHEAQLATLKANQLLLKYNLERLDSSSFEKYFYLKRILTAKRRSAKLSAIYDILKHFLVNPIFIYGKKQISIEVSGSKENIELAEYIALFLDEELERQWHSKKMKK